MIGISLFLWVGFPYLALALLIGGLIWRYRNDKFGWTSRSSQIHESRWLRWSSPLFHFGILFVGVGHIVGLLIPKSATSAVGVSEHFYHLNATVLGSVAGIMTLVGLAGLLYRRIVVKSVRLATTRNDVIMYILLLIPIILGVIATVQNQIFGATGGYDYRESISPWLRSVLFFQPDPSLLDGVPTAFKLHIIAGFLLFAIWPFTRLVHVVSMPLGYPTRPYVIYRSREDAIRSTKTPDGWDPVATRQDSHGSRSMGA
ncbi:respiratory nitrate reductase subunit gamma [Arcanobacterium ihumii]|uniref:respiratory nitrate reductase subunit gamma n=1 Tax=Arcanobacterium ihumii TaxID=2138162 RepID=UPI000F532679|nr:respiratory nitrate reductase subunit gamma [Arcanobacterium ihumii]